MGDQDSPVVRPETVDASTADVTALLLRWGGGDRGALDALVPLVYDELRQLAAYHLRREHARKTLDTVSLVHEAYLRLVDQQRTAWRDRAQFFSVAAWMMRRILVDRARRHRYAKRGGGRVPVSLDEVCELGTARAPELLALDEALDALGQVDPELVRVVELRYFGGLSAREIAAVIGQSSRTVGRRWRIARAWLHDHLDPGSSR